MGVAGRRAVADIERMAEAAGAAAAAAATAAAMKIVPTAAIGPRKFQGNFRKATSDVASL